MDMNMMPYRLRLSPAGTGHIRIEPTLKGLCYWSRSAGFSHGPSQG